MKLLEIHDLKTHFFTDAGILPSVDGISFEINQGEILGVVGESGCGKSVTAMSILRIIPEPPGRIVAGRILFDGHDLVSMPIEALRKIRGRDIAMIFQEPMTSLNPVYTVGEQLREVLSLHLGLDDDAARARIVEMFSLVGISEPAMRVDAYPHQMSGGMKQRVMIAMALCCSPRLLIADEPTTALDVTVQAQILNLLVKLRDERGLGVMLITHDLGVVAETCDRVVVMYAGRVVETACVQDLFAHPSHPYTVGLLQSLPDAAKPGSRLQTIPGNVPSPLNFPTGCRFRDRCSRASSACSLEPPLHVVGDGHEVRCHHPYQGGEHEHAIA